MKRCSNIDKSFLDFKLLNPIYPNIPSLWSLLNERISTLEIQSRSYENSANLKSSSFFKFLNSQNLFRTFENLILIRLICYFTPQNDYKMDEFLCEIERKIWDNILLPQSLLDNLTNNHLNHPKFEFDFDIFNEDIFMFFLLSFVQKEVN